MNSAANDSATFMKPAIYAETMIEYLEHVNRVRLSPDWRARRTMLQIRLALTSVDDVTALGWANTATSHAIHLDEVEFLDQQAIRDLFAMMARIRAKRKAAS